MVENGFIKGIDLFSLQEIRSTFKSWYCIIALSPSPLILMLDNLNVRILMLDNYFKPLFLLHLPFL